MKDSIYVQITKVLKDQGYYRDDDSPHFSNTSYDKSCSITQQIKNILEDFKAKGEIDDYVVTPYCGEDRCGLTFFSWVYNDEVLGTCLEWFADEQKSHLNNLSIADGLEEFLYAAQVFDGDFLQGDTNKTVERAQDYFRFLEDHGIIDNYNVLVKNTGNGVSFMQDVLFASWVNSDGSMYSLTLNWEQTTCLKTLETILRELYEQSKKI